MLLKAFNKSLIRDREKTYLTASGSAGDTTITVASTDLAPDGASSNTWTDNNYMIVGEIGSENAEIMQINGAISSATSFTVDREGQAGGLRYDHSVGEPVYRIGFNRVEFSRNTTDTTSGVSVLTTVRLQPDDLFTRYEDVTNTTGYGFARFNNETSGAFSSYSDGVNYAATGTSSSRDPRTLWMIRKKVRDLLDETDDSKLDDEKISESVNDKQRDIAHMRLWPFYETERSFASVANQFAYALPTTVQKIHSIRYDTQPLIILTKNDWDLNHWDTDQSTADPSHATIWNRELLLYPRPSGSAQTTTINDTSGISATDTTITVASTSGFNRGDYYRFIIDSEVIYATASTATTFTGARRAREGTSAASHSDGATVTERNIVYTAHVEPTDLIDTQARTLIPEPEVLVYGTAMDLALFLQDSNKHDRLFEKYTAAVESLKAKYGEKQSGQFGRIKDASEVIEGTALPKLNPNLFPRDIN